MNPSVRQLADAAWALLQTAPAGVAKYREVVDSTPPVDAGGVVKGYAVLHASPGNDTPNNMAGVQGNILWDFYIEVCGGDDDYLLGAVDIVRGLFTGKTLTVANHGVGLMRPPPGAQPRKLINQLVSPARWYVQLEYNLLAVA